MTIVWSHLAVLVGVGLVLVLIAGAGLLGSANRRG
jgi:hypothetical protein